MSTIGGTKMYGSNGLSGLVSGMDTEGMVEALLSGTQSKIDSKYQKKQQLEWKQEIYRDVISDLRTFQTKFFSYSNPASNLLSNSFFNSLASDIGSSSAMNVTASSNAVSGNTTIDKITQLASATKKTSGGEVSGKIEGALDLTNITATAEVAIKIGDTEHNVTLDASSEDALKDSINAAFIASGTDATAAVNAEGKLVIDGKGEEITISGSSDGLAVLGLSKTTTATGELETMHDLSKGKPYLTINMDGVDKKIILDFTFENTNDPVKKQAFADELQKKIDSTLGKGIKVDYNSSTDKISFEGLNGRQVTLTGGSAIEGLGIEKGTSNKISLNTKLKDVNFLEPLQGDTFVFKINGVTLAASGDESLKSIMERVNNSDAGVTMSYSSSQDKFVIESKTSGKGVAIEMSQDTGNLLTAMFGTKPSGGVASGQLKKDNITANGLPKDFTGITSGEFKLKINGTVVTVNLPEKKNDDGTLIDYNVDTAITEINKQLDSRVSQGYVKLENTGGNIVIKTSSEWNVSVEDSSIAGQLGFDVGQTTKADAGTTLSELGLSGTIKVGGADIELTKTKTIEQLATEIDTALGAGTCKYDETAGVLMISGVESQTTISGLDPAANTSLEKMFGSSAVTLGGTSETVLSSGDFTGKEETTPIGVSGTIEVNGTKISLTTDMTLKSVATKIQGAIGEGTCTYDKDKGGFVICGVNIPVTIEAKEGDEAAKTAMGKLFGQEVVDYTGDGTTLANKGTNAVLSVNGKEIEKNTNNFTMDGLDIELKEKTDEKITINTTKNTEQISKGIEDFVTEYNNLIEKLNGLVHEDTDYKEYPPLTDDQRKDMTEDQIKLWEEKAKTGLVRNDSIVSGFLQDMRNVLYQKPAGCDIALYDLGIETSKDYKDYGKLIIKDPKELENMIETKSDQIQKLFTSETDGVSVKLNDALDNVAKASSAHPGSLVQLAGVKGGILDGNDSISKNIKDVDDSLKSLKMKYKMEKTRYWKQFNSMEQMIQKMNQQSSWLMQQFA